MTIIKEHIQWRATAGEAVKHGDLTIRPQARSLIVRWPGGGWVWNRPTTLLVEQVEETRRIPIVDVTRRIQLAFLGLSLIFSLIYFFLSRKQGRRNHV